MSDELYEARTFEEFWVRYQRAHADPRTRRAHAAATLSAAALIATGVVSRQPALIVAAPLVDYAIAQASHRRVEGNRTTPWRRPVWHVRAELRLCRHTLGDAWRARRERRFERRSERRSDRQSSG